MVSACGCGQFRPVLAVRRGVPNSWKAVGRVDIRSTADGAGAGFHKKADARIRTRSSGKKSGKVAKVCLTKNGVGNFLHRTGIFGDNIE